MAEQDNIPTSLQQRYKLKKITRGELRKNLLKFKKEFQKFGRKVKILTPQADCGIGPVQYNVTLGDIMKISKVRLKMLDTVIKSEKVIGDALIKFDASLLFLASGKEDPRGFLPPGCRAAIRTEIQDRTRKILEKEKLAFETRDAQRDDSESILYNLIRSTESQPRPPNPAEFALICDVGQPLDEDDNALSSQHVNYTYAGIKGIMEKRRRERKHIKRIRKVIYSQFEAGVKEAMKMAVDEELDGTTDMLEEEQTALTD